MLISRIAFSTHETTDNVLRLFREPNDDMITFTFDHYDHYYLSGLLIVHCARRAYMQESSQFSM